MCSFERLGFVNIGTITEAVGAALYDRRAKLITLTD
jgi:hypothetical protein